MNYAIPPSGRRALEAQLTEITDSRVRAALTTVPRHVFVPEHLQASAYADSPLPIGHGQTISQPLMVAHLLQAAELKPHEHVLDVGCGSGYQAALLNLLVADVVGVELVPELARLARANLAKLGISSVEVHEGNGREGCPAHAPYDAILVAAASEHVPPALLEQLKEGGRLLIPVGRGDSQILERWTRRGEAFERKLLTACRFVPLVEP